MLLAAGHSASGLLPLQALPNLSCAPPRTLLSLGDDRGGRSLIDRLRAVMRGPAALGQTGASVLLKPFQPLVRGFARDAVFPAQFRHRTFSFQPLGNQRVALIQSIPRFLPGHLASF